MSEYPISHYDILANAVDIPNLKVNVTISGNNVTFFNVTGLLPGTTYELTVVAVSIVRDVVARSQPSNLIQRTTALTAAGKTYCRLRLQM